MTPFEHFRDRYCGHQGATIIFDTDEEASLGCAYKDEKSASCWDDWQKCTEANCPFFQRMEVRWKQL